MAMAGRGRRLALAPLINSEAGSGAPGDPGDPGANPGDPGGDTGGGPVGPVGVYRTDITINTRAHWRTLERLAPVFLAQGDNWAQVFGGRRAVGPTWRGCALTPKRRRTPWARWPPPPPKSKPRCRRLCWPWPARWPPPRHSTPPTPEPSPPRAPPSAARWPPCLPTSPPSPPPPSVDTDGDGLTNDQEAFWCTSVSGQDSDGDGTKDGAEVTSLKNWMNNKLSQAPSTRKPFAGWPNQTTCLDDDYDSIRQPGQWNELGLRGDTRSTNLDKFDDGEEVFGITSAPAATTTAAMATCRAAPTPVLSAPTCSSVKAPGNHPLVAAFPVPEVNMVQSSFQVQPFTIITTEQGTMTQSAKSYSTSKTEGTSSSVSDTTTWNDWQETSETKALAAAAVTTVYTKIKARNYQQVLSTKMQT